MYPLCTIYLFLFCFFFTFNSFIFSFLNIYSFISSIFLFISIMARCFAIKFFHLSYYLVISIYYSLILFHKLLTIKSSFSLYFFSLFSTFNSSISISDLDYSTVCFNLVGDITIELYNLFGEGELIKD